MVDSMELSTDIDDIKTLDESKESQLMSNDVDKSVISIEHSKSKFDL